MIDELDNLTQQQRLLRIEEKLDLLIAHLDKMLRIIPEPQEKSHSDKEANDHL